MKGRIYDPEARRFLTPDPIQTPASSQSHNRYSYVQNNPATLTDPTGYVWNPPTDGGPSIPSGTGPFNPGPDGTGSFCANSPLWTCVSLGGSLNETPTPTDAGPTPSSDDDNASTADNGSVPAEDPEPCSSPCVVGHNETIEVQGKAPVEDDETAADDRGTTATSDDHTARSSIDISLPARKSYSYDSAAAARFEELLGAMVDALEEGKGLPPAAKSLVVALDAITDVAGLRNMKPDKPPEGVINTISKAFMTASNISSGLIGFATIVHTLETGLPVAIAAAEVSAVTPPIIAGLATVGTVTSLIAADVVGAFYAGYLLRLQANEKARQISEEYEHQFVPGFVNSVLLGPPWSI